MITVTLEEARNKLASFIRNLKAGEELWIMENDRPIAKIIGQTAISSHRPGPGLCKDMITIIADDEEHLEYFADYA